MQKEETVYTAMVYAILRHLLSAAAGILVTKGYITSELATKFSDTAAMQLTLGIAGFLVAIWLSYRNKIWEFVKTRIAILLPPSSTLQTVTVISKNVEDKSAVASGDIPDELKFVVNGGKTK